MLIVLKHRAERRLILGEVYCLTLQLCFSLEVDAKILMTLQLQVCQDACTLFLDFAECKSELTYRQLRARLAFNTLFTVPLRTSRALLLYNV